MTLEDITLYAFKDEMSKLASAGSAAAAATKAADDVTLWKLLMKHKTGLGIAGIGAGGSILAGDAYKDWQAGHQMRKQMGG